VGVLVFGDRWGLSLDLEELLLPILSRRASRAIPESDSEVVESVVLRSNEKEESRGERVGAEAGLILNSGGLVCSLADVIVQIVITHLEQDPILQFLRTW